jgi:hypothetical protein
MSGRFAAGVIGAVLGGALVYGGLRYVDAMQAPEAVRAFRRHREMLERYVAAERAVTPAADLAKLRTHLPPAGFTGVSREEDCTRFYFTTRAGGLDSFHEIIYSPQGFRGLPDMRRQGRSIYRQEPLDGAWYFVIYD